MQQGWLAMVAVLLSGVATSVQAAMNAQLRGVFGHAVLGALVNFTIGLVSLGVLAWCLRLPVPPLSAAAQAPIWAWFGGMLGAFIVASLALAAAQLSATTILVVFLVGQATMALILDHFALLGFARAPVSSAKCIGLVLMGAGVWLVRRG